MTSTGKTLAVAAVAALALTQTLAQAAHAEVTRSDKNDPRLAIEDQMQALLGSEKTRLKALSGTALDTIAAGPAAVAVEKAPAKTAAKTADKTAAKAKAPAKGETPVALPQADLQPIVPALATAPRYDTGWLLAQPEPAGDADWQCLSEAIYFESRGESLQGQFAVAEVILNRRDSGLYPRSVCGVVGQRGGGGCQFSYVCDGAADTMREPGPRAIARRIARVMLDGAPRLLTDGATHFHTRGVSPGWAKRFPRTAAIGSHLFYRQPGAGGS